MTVPKRGHSRESITLHRATLTPADRAALDRVPTTSLARTLLDLASCTPRGAVVRALEEAERRRLIERDRKRDAALLRAGYRTLRVTALRLEAEPEAILAEVGVLLQAT